MSGGSHNYLFRKELLGDSGYLLNGMAERLEEIAGEPGSLPLSDRANLIEAAMATRAIGAVVNLLATDSLRGVWRSVEWFDSADAGQDDVLAACDEFAKTLSGGW